MSAVEEVDYLEETGPGILELPESPVAPPELPAGPASAQQYPGWERDTIETFLRGTGAGVHMLIGQTEKDWLLTEEDLKRIAPPLTRICNRWEPALRASPYADPFLVGHGLFLYGWRSVLEVKRAQADEEREQEEGERASYIPADEAPPAAAAEPSDNGSVDLGDIDIEDLDMPQRFPGADSRNPRQSRRRQKP